MLSLQDVIARNSTPTPQGVTTSASQASGAPTPQNTVAPQAPPNSLQLIVNRFAHRYDANLREYTEITLLQVLSGGVKPKT